MKTAIVIIVILVVVGIVAFILINKAKASGTSAQDQFMQACLLPHYQNNQATCIQAYQVAVSKGLLTWNDWLNYWLKHPNG